MKTNTTRSIVVSAVAIGICFCIPAGQAQTVITWTGSGADGLWSNGQNWSSGSGFTGGDEVVFDGTTNLAATNDTAPDNPEAWGLFFNPGAGAFTLSGNDLYLGGPVVFYEPVLSNNSTSTQTINLNLDPNDGASLTVNAVGNIVMNGAILPSGPDNVNLLKTGIGTLTLSGSNNISNSGGGQWNIEGGTVDLDFSTNTPVTSMSYSVLQNSSTLELNGNGSQATTINLTQYLHAASDSTLATIAFNDNGGPGITLSGTTLVNGGFASQGTLFVKYANSDTLTFSGNIADESNGIYPYMVVQDSGGIGFGTSTESGSGTIERYTGATALTDTVGSSSINYITSGSLTLTTGPGDETQANSLQIDTSGGSGNLNLDNTLFVLTNYTAQGAAVLMTGNNNFTITGSGAGAIFGYTGGSPSQLYIHQYGSGTLTISVPLGTSGASNGLNLSKDGPGTVNITSNQTYSGGTYIQQGTFLANASIASSTMTVDPAGTLGGSGVVAEIDANGGRVAPGSDLPGILTSSVLSGTGTINFTFRMTSLVVGGTSAPTYGNAFGSGNDVLDLAGGTPFALTLNSSDVITVNFTGMTLHAGDVIQGGFYTDQGNFLSSFSGATFNYLGLGSGFTVSEVTTVQETANFAGGTQDGYVSEFVIAAVPEPSETALLLIGGVAACAILMLRRSRRGMAPRSGGELSPTNVSKAGRRHLRMIS